MSYIDRKEAESISADKIYNKGYEDGVRDANENTGIHAYYAGVGYGKSSGSDKNLGFRTREHYRAFEKGIQEKDKHFISVNKKPTFLERILAFFGLGDARHVQRLQKERKRNKKNNRSAVKAKRKLYKTAYKEQKKLGKTGYNSVYKNMQAARSKRDKQRRKKKRRLLNS